MHSTIYCAKIQIFLNKVPIFSFFLYLCSAKVHILGVDWIFQQIWFFTIPHNPTKTHTNTDK